MDVTYTSGSSKFNYRVCAVIISQGRILAMRDERSPYYYLPGGRVKLGETAEAAVLREVREELEISAEIVRPLWLCQSFFTEDVDGLDYHELCLYFLIDADGSGLLSRGESFTLYERGHTHIFEWLPFERLENEYFYPLFMKKAVFDLPERLTLITAREPMKDAAVIACTSLREYVEAAQAKLGTNYPVFYLDRKYHRDPVEMREHVLELIARLPAGVRTALVVMGFCGGSWEGVSAPCRIVMPRVDDCVSLLLQTGDSPKSDLKQPRSLYVRAKDPADESFRAIFESMTRDADPETKRRYHDDWKRLYDRVFIIDTGLNDCRRPEYFETVKRDADWLEAETEYVPGGTRLIEKLLSGEWDGQFLVLEPGQKASAEKVLIREA